MLYCSALHKYFVRKLSGVSLTKQILRIIEATVQTSLSPSDQRWSNKLKDVYCPSSSVINRVMKCFDRIGRCRFVFFLRRPFYGESNFRIDFLSNAPLK